MRKLLPSLPFAILLAVLTALFAGLSIAQGPLTTAMNLMVRTDSNGSLYTYGVAAGAQGPLQNFGNIALRTYNGGDLGVVINGGTITPNLVTCSQNGIITTSTDCLVAQNTTAATGTVTVQMSPRLRLRGTAWDTAASETVDFFAENLPATAATPTGTLKFGYSLNGAAAIYPLTVNSVGAISSTGGGGFGFGGLGGASQGMSISGSTLKLTSGGNGATTLIQFAGNDGASNTLQFSASSTKWTAPADAQYNITNSAVTAGIGFDVSTDSTIKIRTRAQSAYGTVDALAYNASGAAGVTGTCDTPTFTGGVVTTCGGAGNSVDGTYFVTGNFTTANNTNFQLITGLSWTFPANAAVNTPFRCSLTYSQATAAVSDSLGIQDVTVAPTNGMFGGSAETALGTTAYGDLTAFSSTTATAVVTFTPSAITTIFQAYIDGMIEQPSNASTSSFQIQIKTTAGADAITVYRGSYCKVG